jgi:hypothetical protein
VDPALIEINYVLQLRKNRSWIKTGSRLVHLKVNWPARQQGSSESIESSPDTTTSTADTPKTTPGPVRVAFFYPKQIQIHKF